MGERAADELRYTAFLSYSHRDAAGAGRLHRRLEAYRMPRRLVGLDTPRGPVPERIAPIFRDREELPAATDLSETVREALARSGALIILCSPSAAGSLWVAEEIRVFRELNPDRPILAAVFDGDPPDCFPAALRAFGRDGIWHEPLATDLRPHRDGMRLGVLKLVAGITGVGLDALVQRDASRRVRRIMGVTVGALIALLITAALALAALSARREAERQRLEAEGLVEFMLTDLRDRLRGVGRLDVMSAVNRRALRYYDRQLALNARPSDSVMRARVKHAVGETELSAGNKAAAFAAFREAYRLSAALIRRFPNDADVVFAHAQSEYWIGYADYQRGNRAAAEVAWQRYRALADHLVAIGGQNPDWLREMAYAEGNICAAAMHVPVEAAAALRSCSSALGLMRQAYRLRGAEPSIVEGLVNRHGWMVDVLNANGDWEGAMAHRRAHEALLEALIHYDPANYDYREIRAGSEMGFGELLARRGDHAGARRHLHRAAEEVGALLAHDPANASWRGLQQRIAGDLQREAGHGG